MSKKEDKKDVQVEGLPYEERRKLSDAKAFEIMKADVEAAKKAA